MPTTMFVEINLEKILQYSATCQVMTRINWNVSRARNRVEIGMEYIVQLHSIYREFDFLKEIFGQGLGCQSGGVGLRWPRMMSFSTSLKIA